MKAKSGNRLLSLALILALLTTTIGSFQVSAATGFDNYLSRYNLTTYEEYIDGVRYTYTIDNGEAAIVHIFSNFGLTGQTILELPVSLGGYPVTTLGHIEEKMEVFAYFNDGEDISDSFPGFSDSDYIEYDYGLRDKTLVIPEGYENITYCALNGINGYVIFPKSLKKINHVWYISEKFYGNETFIGKSTFIFPECKYSSDFSFDFVNDSYVFPSRSPYVSVGLFPKYYYINYTVPKALCFPSNTSSNIIRSALYDLSGTPVSWYKGATVYCPADSEFISVIEEMGGYTVNTDVPVAEYIEFPSETVNVHVGDVMDLEAKSYPENATWTACDYVSSDPSVVEIDEYSGRITALKEGTVTITATHCERGYVDTCTVNVTPEPEPGVNGVEPATDTPYVAYGNRDYLINVTGSPSKIQVVRDNGGTTTIDRRRATVTSNGDTETWLVNMRVEAGTHNIRAKYGTVWADRLTPFTVTYDLPEARSLDFSYENGIGTFNVVTDPEVTKIRFVLDNGATLTYHQGYSTLGEDGLRHWTVIRSLNPNQRYTLYTKYGYTWTPTDFTAET